MSDIAELSKTPPVSPILWLVLNRQVTSHCVLISTCNCFKYIFANFQIFNFHCHIWKQHEKFIQMSTNKPSIGAVVLEITPWILRKHRQIPIFLHSSVESKKCILEGATSWRSLETEVGSTKSILMKCSAQEHETVKFKLSVWLWQMNIIILQDMNVFHCISIYTTRFPLNDYVGLIKRPTTVATVSRSTIESTMRVLCSYCMCSSFCHSSISIPSWYPQRYTPTCSSHSGTA